MTLDWKGRWGRLRPACGALRMIAALAALAAAGCCSFDRDWKAAQNVCYPGDPLAGVWEGTWESQVDGHHGKLRAIIEPCGPNTYRARYRATFCGFIPYGYETTHTASVACGAAYFCGKENLGHCAGGEHSYWGLANGSMYEAGYLSEKDEGVFRMKRAGQCCGGAGCVGDIAHDTATHEGAAPMATPETPPAPSVTGDMPVRQVPASSAPDNVPAPPK